MSRRHSPKIIQLEFNELSESLLKRFMDAGVLPNFKRLYESSDIFRSSADVPVDYLEPWIQWPTVHSGLEYREHGIFHLGEGNKLRGKTIGSYLSEAGYKVGIFGSMNCGYQHLNGYVIPDPWDEGGRAYPQFLAPFVNFVSSQVQESSRATGLSLSQLLPVGWFLARHGMRGSTVWSGLRQLLAEKLNPRTKWRRAMVMEKICYDLFRYLNSRFEVDFATFFCNSTAHFQHYYWRNFEPGGFALAPGQSEQKVFAGALQAGYVAMDKIVGRVLADYPRSMILFCTALSQKPWQETTKCLFRIRNPLAFLEFAGVREMPQRIRPVMAQQFYFDFTSEEAASRALNVLERLRVRGEPLCWFVREGASLFGGCSVEDAGALSAIVQCESSGKSVGFSELFYQIHGMRSGRHDPAGSWWVRRGRHQVHEQSIALTQIAPTILAQFQVPPDPQMRGQALRFEC